MQDSQDLHHVLSAGGKVDYVLTGKAVRGEAEWRCGVWHCVALRIRTSAPPTNPLGNHPTWREQDWDWDPLTVQARPREGTNCTVQPCAAAPAAAAPQSHGGGGGRKRKLASTPAKPTVCQADGCGRALGGLTFYHQRNKICDLHIKADCFVRDGLELRFCQVGA